jgi:hypothetical protein
MITAAGSEAGPGGIGPGAAIRAGCADSGGRGQGQHRMGLGYGGPGTRCGLAVSLAEQPVRLSGEFLGAAGNAQVRSLLLHISRRPGSESDTTHGPVDLPRRFHAHHGDEARPRGLSHGHGQPGRRIWHEPDDGTSC